MQRDRLISENRQYIWSSELFIAERRVGAAGAESGPESI